MPLPFTPNKVPLQYRNTLYCELEDSPEGSYRRDDGQISRRILVPWPARNQAELDFAGDAQVLDAGDGRRYIVRTNPHQFAPKSWFFVQSIPGEKPIALRGTEGGPFNGLGNAKYSLCELTLVYATLPYLVREDHQVLNDDESDDHSGLPDEGYALEQGWFTHSRYVSKVERMATRSLTIPHAAMKDQDNRPIVEALPLSIPGGEVLYEWWGVPVEGLPEATWMSMGNSVNDAPFDGFPTGTLLWEGKKEVRRYQSPISGRWLANVTYSFSAKLQADPTTSDPVVMRGHKYTMRVIQHAGNTIVAPRLFQSNGSGPAVAGTTPIQDLNFRRLFRPDPAS